MSLSIFEDKLGEVLTVIGGAIAFIIWLVRLEGKLKSHVIHDKTVEKRVENIENQLPGFGQQMSILVADIREIKTNIQWLIQVTKKLEE